MLVLLALDKKTIGSLKMHPSVLQRVILGKLSTKHWILKSTFCGQQVKDTSSVVHPQVFI